MEAYGFHDVWTDGRVKNEKAFLSAFKQRMIERSKQEWYTKISKSERFPTYFSSKTIHQLETYLNHITIKKVKDTLIILLSLTLYGLLTLFLIKPVLNN